MRKAERTCQEKAAVFVRGLTAGGYTRTRTEGHTSYAVMGGVVILTLQSKLAIHMYIHTSTLPYNLLRSRYLQVAVQRLSHLQHRRHLLHS